MLSLGLDRIANNPAGDKTLQLVNGHERILSIPREFIYSVDPLLV